MLFDVLAVILRRSGLRQMDRSVLFQPFPRSVRSHWKTSVLCFAKPCLYFNIGTGIFCEKMLPSVRTFIVSPGKQFSRTKSSRGSLKKSIAVFIYICNIFGTFIWNVEEIVDLIGNRFIMENIISIDFRDIYLVDLPVFASVGGGSRHDNLSGWIFRNRHVAPPIHRDHLIGMVDNAHPAVQRPALFFQPEIHLIFCFADSFVFVHSKKRDTGIGSTGSSKKRIIGKW